MHQAPAQGMPAQGLCGGDGGTLSWLPHRHGKQVEEPTAFDPEDMDKCMREAMSARSSKKAAAKKAALDEKEEEEKGKGGARKKKKATKKEKNAAGKKQLVVQKKPAAKGAKSVKPNTKHTAPYKKPTTFPWTKPDEQRTKNCYASKWWGRSKTAMKTAGWSEGPMKTECARVYKLASRIWSKHME